MENIIVLEARLTEEEKISFYELTITIRPSGGKKIEERRITEEVVGHMFRPDHSIKDQPFLVQENREFYAILRRNLKDYQEQFNEIKLKVIA
jgi:hypothetical protein